MTARLVLEVLAAAAVLVGLYVLVVDLWLLSPA